jgi:hypothetical protein
MRNTRYIFYLAVAVLAFLMGCVASRLLVSDNRPQIQVSAPRTAFATPIAIRPRTAYDMALIKQVIDSVHISESLR